MCLQGEAGRGGRPGQGHAVPDSGVPGGGVQEGGPEGGQVGTRLAGTGAGSLQAAETQELGAGARTAAGLQEPKFK